MKKTVVGLLALLLAFLTGCNTITPLVSETILNSYSAKAQIGAGDRTQSDNTFSKDEQSNQNGSVEKESASDAKEAAFDDGKILIYNFEQLSMIGSGKSYKYSDGVSATYSMDAEYKLARDIPIPRHTLWQLPEGFKGKISGEKQEYAPLYENASDSLYLYNPYQLATMAMDDAAQQTVLSGDAEAKTFGTGQPVCIDENSKAVLTYSDEHNYVVSAQFDSDMTKKPVSILIGKESEEPLGANAFVPLGAKADSSVGAGTADGRDFQGQVIKNINGTPHILIGNEDQLRAIGTDKDVYSAIYQVKLVGVHFEIDTNGGNPIMLYGGDADLLGTQNGKTDYGFQAIDNKDSNALKYYASVNQNTGEINLDSSHTSLTKSSQITTGKKYSVSENYIIFRDINLGGSARPWKPLMFTGTMYGAKSANGEKLWNVYNLRFVKGNNAAGGYVGMATAASVADVNTGASKGFLQRLLNTLISTPGDLASVMQATVTTIRQAEVNPDNNEFGFTVDGVDNAHPRYAGGFAGSLEASVIGSRKGESDITVNGLRSVDGLYYAGGFVGLADVGSVASVSSTGTGSTSILNLIKAGSVDLLDIFRTYIYYSSVNGVDDGIIVRAYSSAPEGILSETRYSGSAGGFGGGVMNGSVKNSNVTKLNTVYAPNYTGGFIGHMGKNGVVDLDDAQVAGPLAGLNAGVLDIFGTVVDDCNTTGIDAGAVIMSTEGEQPIAGGFAGYADVAQINNSNAAKLKQVYSDQIAGGFVGKTNMNYLVEAEVDSALVQIVLGILNSLLKILQVHRLEEIDLINTDRLLSDLGISNLLGLKLLSDGDLLYVNLLGLRVGVSLVSPDPENNSTGTAVITIGDSTVALPYNEDGIDMNAENAEVVVDLIKGNRTRVDNCSVTGITDGYDVYGGGASNTDDGTHESGYAGGFVGYNNEGKFTSDTMVYCDVVRGTKQKVGPFSGTTSLKSVYSFNTLASIEKVNGKENHYSVYRNTDLTYALTRTRQQIGLQGVTDSGTNYKRFDITHLAAPITPGTNEAYYKIFEKWYNAVMASDAAGTNQKLIKVFASDAKAVLMLDTPTDVNEESLIPNPGESKDPCDQTIKLTVQKVWDDNSNAKKTRPELIKVRIWQHWENEDGTPVMDGSEEKVVLYTDSNVIPDIDTTNGWFNISKADHERSNSATWTRVIEGLPVYTADNDTYYSYTVEENPIVGYNSEITYDETGATATAKIVNTPKEFEIQFKYYDRYEINGKPSGIEQTETVYSVPVNGIPSEFITYDASHNVKSIDFSGLIGAKAVEFANEKLSVTNVMCDYDLWTSQSEAVEAMAGRTYFVGGAPVQYSNNEIYHTDYLGKPHDNMDYTGQSSSKDEKWVNYYDTADNELEEEFNAPEDYLNVNKIVVWCYNYPRKYNVDIYGADSADDLVKKTVGGNTVYVADAIRSDKNMLNKKFYYNQRFGGAVGDASQDSEGFIENYGLYGYTNVSPADCAEEAFDEYTFAYWAYNQEGTQIASVERDFMYRVTDDTKLYAVYAKENASAVGISISANVNDTFVDESGVSRTRLNILGSVYGAPEYDVNVRKLSFVNISLSDQIRYRPDVYTPKTINALFEQYKDQLKELIKENDRKNGSKAFSSDKTYAGDIDEATGEVDSTLNLTLTTKGYIYTVVSNGNTPETGAATATLSNKNRVQFTMVYKTSALNVNNTGTKGDTCLMYCGAVNYNGEWSVSTNCLIYRNGEVVDNTADTWE